MARKYAFKGKLLKVYTEKKKFPNGYVGKLEIVKHPGAVLIIPFLSRDKIVLIKQYRPVINSYIWELPAGTLSKGENPLACAKRELVEEIGYEAKSWKKIGYIYPAPGYTTEKIAIFKASRLKKVPCDRQEDELITSSIFTTKKLQKLVKSSNLVDAKTLAALKLAYI